MLGTQHSERQKTIINLISRIQANYAEIGDYKSHIENSIGAHVVLTNGTIFLPYIAIADIEFAFDTPDFIDYIRDSFTPFNSPLYNSPKQSFWKKIFNTMQFTDKSISKYTFE